MIPTNVMTRNAGNGNMEVRWDAASGSPAYYDVYISNAEDGVYKKANKKQVTGTFCKIHNLPFGSTVYTKVRAVFADGTEGDLSDVAVDAEAPSAVIAVLRATGNVGDQIPAGTVFCAHVNDEVVGFKTLQDYEL